MAQSESSLWDYLKNLNYINDSVANLPFVGSWIPLLILSLAYAIFVLKLGPKYMRHRKAFQIKPLIQAYNIIQILLNLYLVLLGPRLMHVPGEYTFGCMLPLPNAHALKSTEVTFGYMYFMIKVSDYLDTIFFVLRKSFKQVTFLHVYHHILMSIAGYSVLRYYGAGGQHLFIVLLNSFIHVLMYGYYFVSAMYPEVKESKWKSHLTKLQIIQFIMVLSHNLWPLLFHTDCRYPRILSYFNVLQSLIILSLFSNFYIKAYLKKRRNSITELSKLPKKSS